MRGIQPLSPFLVWKTSVLGKGVSEHCQRHTQSQYITRLFVLIIAWKVEQIVYNNKQPYRNTKWRKRENIKISRATARRHMIDLTGEMEN